MLQNAFYMKSYDSRHIGHCTCFFLCVVMLALSVNAAMAQETDLATASTTATSTEATVVVDEMSQPTPYPTEGLLGNEVFEDFVVGPGKIEITIKPGETKVVEFTVSNRTGARRIFEIDTEDITGSQDPSQALILLGDDRGPYSLKDYVRVPTNRFALDHNTRARIPVTISLPATAEPGGLYGSLLVSTVTQEGRAGDGMGTAPQSAVVARIGASLFVTIPGTAVREGAFTEFGIVPPQTFFQQGPIPFGLLFENTGAAHLAPYGEIRIRNIFGEEVGFLEIQPWFVLPKAVRLREVSWEREVLFGRYTATALINRSYDDVIDEKSITFWVLPWKPIMLGILGCFVVVLLIRLFFKRFEFKRKA